MENFTYLQTLIYRVLLKNWNNSGRWEGECHGENLFGLSGEEDERNMKDHRGGECLTT